MKLVIPPECKIGAHTFRIQWSPKVLDVQGARGGAEYRDNHLIRLMPNRPTTATFQTLIHEVLHLIDFTLGSDNDIPEGVIRLLAGGLAQFLLSIGIEPDFSQIQEGEF